MRKSILLCLIAFTIPAVANAGVQYEFRQTTRSDMDPQQRPGVTGRGIIEGQKSRVDFHSGSEYGPGTYIVSDDGGKRVRVVNTNDKTYAELDVASAASAIGSRKIRVENLKTDFRKLDDKTIVAGLPTEHYRLIARYDMTVSFGELSITQSVETTVEKWTTAAFGDVAQSFFASGLLKTNNPELDALIEAETGKFAGFPLRQVVTVLTTAKETPQQSRLPVKPQRRQVSEMVVTAIEARDLPASQFAVPAGFKKVDRPTALEKNAAENVTLE